MTVNVLGALFSRHSDIGLDKLSGPVGIFDVLYKTALNDIRWFLYILVPTRKQRPNSLQRNTRGEKAS